VLSQWGFADEEVSQLLRGGAVRDGTQAAAPA
jgi:hypothetical protein